MDQGWGPAAGKVLCWGLSTLSKRAALAKGWWHGTLKIPIVLFILWVLQEFFCTLEDLLAFCKGIARLFSCKMILEGFGYFFSFGHPGFSVLCLVNVVVFHEDHG